VGVLHYNLREQRERVVLEIHRKRKSTRVGNPQKKEIHKKGDKMPDRVSVKTCDLIGVLWAITHNMSARAQALHQTFQTQNTIQSFKEFRELESAFKEAYEAVQNACRLLDRRST